MGRDYRALEENIVGTVRFFFFFTAFMILQASAVAADDHEISQRLQGYWASYSAGEYRKAADFILPADLRNMQDELLPVFIAASQSPEQELQDIAKLFLSEIRVVPDSEASPAQVFVGFNKLMSSINPAPFSALEHSSIDVTDIAWASESEAIVAYRIVIQGVPASDTDRFEKHDQRWYLRLKEPPSDTAIKLRRAFGL